MALLSKLPLPLWRGSDVVSSLSTLGTNNIVVVFVGVDPELVADGWQVPAVSRDGFSRVDVGSSKST